jgi:FAD/FMN-containing dehydrogenase
MPKLTLRAARDLQSSFTGRITSSHEAHAEFRDKPTVLIPESVEDVERALRLVQAANRRAFVRSGRSISATEVTKPSATARRAATVRKSADAIVSLEAFRDIDVNDDRITVGASATTGDIARKLADTSLFLPLDDNRTQSVVSAVLSMGASPFLRSGAGSGPLRNAVVEAEVVPTTGAGAGRARVVRNKALRDVLTGGRLAVITTLVLDADAEKTDESDRWMQAWTAAYERMTFAALCDALFAAGEPKIPERVDLSVRVTSAAYSMTIVIVRATGHGDAKAVEAIVQAAFEKAALTVLESRQVAGPGSSVATWVATGPGEAAPGEIVARFGSNGAPRPFAKFRTAFLEAVDVAIGISPRTGRERTPRVRAWAELQLAPRGGVIASAEISDADADAKVAKEARDRMARAIKPDKASLRGVTVSPSPPPTPGFELVSNNCPGDNIIPGFKGCVFQKSDGRKYANAIQQYAVSSFPPAVVQARMTPRYVAVPEDATDVTLAVTFAAKQGFKVVTRSGGHQYCGMSSGGSDTLLLDMRLFHDVTFRAPSRSGVPTQVTVGPGVALKDGSKQLRDHGVVIPHGECPLVNLGGHVQTGGLGHEVRSLGATLDWIRSFKMVTRDPQSPPGTDVYVEREFTRPAPGGNTAAPTDADVFRAVLGGGPSSFGVVTEYCFDLVADREYPSSAGYSYPYLYLFGETKEGFRTAMERLRQWADLQSRGKLPQGVDLFLTILSGDFPRPPALLVEAMCRDKAHLPDITSVVNAIDAAVPGWIRLTAHRLAPVKGPTKLSVIADEGVRKIGITGLPKSGREFDLPYKKSTHCTLIPFTTKFRDDFVELVNDVYEAEGVKVVFQGGVGGGEFSANAQKKTTHMQRRGTLALIVFDVFYEDGYESHAEVFQKRMKDLLAEFSGGADVRMLWGSFEDKDTNGAQLDMSLPATQALYYDSGDEYARLQQIKKYTDPNDLFHTSFNVQKPS